jgi:hypothetical protein
MLRMTTAELIKILQQLPKGAVIQIEGYGLTRFELRLEKERTHEKLYRLFFGKEDT